MIMGNTSHLVLFQTPVGFSGTLPQMLLFYDVPPGCPKHKMIQMLTIT